MATISARSAADLEVINRLVHDASLDTEALSFDEATGELSLPVVVSVWVSGEGAWFWRQFLGGGYAKRDLMLVLHSVTEYSVRDYEQIARYSILGVEWAPSRGEVVVRSIEQSVTLTARVRGLLLTATF